jgi:hypothetical protein
VDYLYGDLSPEKERTFRRHLNGCAACQRELSGLQAARDALDIRPEPQPDPGVMVDYLQFLNRIAPERSLMERFSGWIEKWIVRPPAVLRLAEVGLAVLVGFVVGTGTFRQSAEPQPSVVRIYADAATLQRVLGDAEMIILETVNSEVTGRPTEVDARISQSLRLLGLTADIRGQSSRRDPELDELLTQLTDIIQLISVTAADEYPEKIDSIRQKVRSTHILSRISNFRGRDRITPTAADGI